MSFSAQILDGRLVADNLLSKLSEDVKFLKTQNLQLKLSIILVGNNPASIS